MDGPEEKRETAASFGAAATAYLDSDAHRTGEDLETLAEWCRGAGTTVDVATGAGHTAGAVAAVGVETVVAVDSSPEMVETAVDAFDVAGLVGDAERLPIATNGVDAVTCRIAAHHFPDPEAFVDEVARVLRPGGTVAFEDNVAPDDPDVDAVLDRLERLRDPTHVRSHPTAQWCSWFEQRGFAVEDVLHFKKTLEFEPWVAAQSLEADRRERVERLLLEAPEEVASALEVRVDDGAVESFANRKALIRARLSE